MGDVAAHGSYDPDRSLPRTGPSDSPARPHRFDGGRKKPRTGFFCPECTGTFVSKPQHFLLFQSPNTFSERLVMIDLQLPLVIAIDAIGAATLRDVLIFRKYLHKVAMLFMAC